MNLLCRIVACFGGNGGDDRRGVFAVGVPIKTVVLGMQCYGCHCFLQELRVGFVCFIFACKCECKDVSIQKHEARLYKGQVSQARADHPSRRYDIRTETSPNFFLQVSRGFFLLHIIPGCLHNKVVSKLKVS